MEAAAAAGARSSSQVRRAKKRSTTTAAQIDVVVGRRRRTTFEIDVEAAAVSASHIPRRRRTAQIRIPSRRAKTVRPHPVSNPPHDHPNWVVSPVRAPPPPPPPPQEGVVDADDSNKRKRSPREDSDDHHPLVPCCHNWREQPSPRDLDDEAALLLPPRPDLNRDARSPGDSDNDADSDNRHAKRARTTNLPCCWRDWSNLGDGPVGLIAERVLAYDVADYVRFRAVCSPWRQSSTEPRTHSGLDRRFHPSKWTMLQEELTSPTGRSFLNTSTGQCVQIDIPELRDHELLALTPEGLLVLARQPPCATTLCMLNPLTRQLIQLPPLSSFLPSEFHDDMLPERDALSLQGSHFRAWGSGILNDDSTVLLCFHHLYMLGMAKPGDDHWTLLEYDDGCIRATPMMFQGCFYCINRSGLMVLEKTGGPPRLEVAAKLNMPFCRMMDTFHLVNICEQLMLVHCHLGRMGRALFYDTYRVDLDTGTLLLVKRLGSAGHALFLGMRCSLSVSPKVFPSGSICADTIYLSSAINSRESMTDGGYHLADDSVELPNSFVSRPHTLAECLSLASTIR